MRGTRVAILLALGLSGCAGVHAYNEARVGYATSAKSAFDKADFDGFMQTRRANLDALHARDLQLAELRAKADRDSAIMAVFTAQTDWIQLDKGLAEQDEYSGVATNPMTPPPDCATWSTTVAGDHRLIATCFLGSEFTVGQQRSDLAASENGFRLAWRADPPVCDSATPLPADWAGGPPPAELPKRYAPLLKDLQPDALRTKQLTYADDLKKCKDLLASEAAETAALAPFAAARTDSLPDLHARLLAAKAFYNSQVAQAQEAADSLQAASDALQKAAAAAPSETASEDISKAEGDVRSALKGLEAAGQATGIGQLEAAKAKLAAIDAFIAAISDSGPDAKATAQPTAPLTPELADAAAVLKAVPTLADQVAAVGGTLNAPRLSALELEKAHQTAVVAQAARTRARAAQRVTVLQEAYDDRVEALTQLNNARLERRKALHPRPPANGQKPLDVDALNVEALDYYQIAVYLASRSNALLRANQLDLEEQAAADQAQFAIDSYRAAISTPLGQFVAYENAGVKASDLAQAISAVATAVGVNIIAGK